MEIFFCFLCLGAELILDTEFCAEQSKLCLSPSEFCPHTPLFWVFWPQRCGNLWIFLIEQILISFCSGFACSILHPLSYRWREFLLLSCVLSEHCEKLVPITWPLIPTIHSLIAISDDVRRLQLSFTWLIPPKHKGKWHLWIWNFSII